MDAKTPTSPGTFLGRRHAWRVAAAGALGTGATVALMPPADASRLDSVPDLRHSKQSRLWKQLEKMVRKKVDQAQREFEEVGLPEAVTSPGSIRDALDSRYVLKGSTSPDTVDAGPQIVVLSEAEYSALQAPNPQTLYVIVA